MENVEVPQKIENRITIWSSNCISEYILKGSENRYWRDICTPMFIAALFSIAKIRKQHECSSIHERINKMWNTNIQLLFSHEKEHPAICNRNGPWAHYAKWDKWDTENQTHWSQDGGGVGLGEHFLPQKFIKRAFKRRVNSTKQLLNAGRGHQTPRKAIQLFERR